MKSISNLLSRLVTKARMKTGYNFSHWCRVAMYNHIELRLEELETPKFALEISPSSKMTPWVEKFGDKFKFVNFPSFDICNQSLPNQFDLIVANQVFEHLEDPQEAARNVYKMLTPGGLAIIATPFLLRVHESPIDVSRWTKTGLRLLLRNAGFSDSAIDVHAWGNRQAVISDLRHTGWTELGYGKNMKNDPSFPVVVWAYARRTTPPFN